MIKETTTGRQLLNKITEAPLSVDIITLGRFDVNRFKKLKKEYDKAVKNNQPTFNFDGKSVDTTFAKYVIELLTPKFGGIKEINEINFKQYPLLKDAPLEIIGAVGIIIKATKAHAPGKKHKNFLLQKNLKILKGNTGSWGINNPSQQMTLVLSPDKKWYFYMYATESDREKGMAEIPENQVAEMLKDWTGGPEFEVQESYETDDITNFKQLIKEIFMMSLSKDLLKEILDEENLMEDVPPIDPTAFSDPIKRKKLFSSLKNYLKSKGVKKPTPAKKPSSYSQLSPRPSQVPSSLRGIKKFDIPYEPKLIEPKGPFTLPQLKPTVVPPPSVAEVPPSSTPVKQPTLSPKLVQQPTVVTPPRPKFKIGDNVELVLNFQLKGHNMEAEQGDKGKIISIIQEPNYARNKVVSPVYYLSKVWYLVRIKNEDKKIPEIYLRTSQQIISPFRPPAVPQKVEKYDKVRVKSNVASQHSNIVSRETAIVLKIEQKDDGGLYALVLLLRPERSEEYTVKVNNLEVIEKGNDNVKRIIKPHLISRLKSGMLGGREVIKRTQKDGISIELTSNDLHDLDHIKEIRDIKSNRGVASPKKVSKLEQRKGIEILIKNLNDAYKSGRNTTSSKNENIELKQLIKEIFTGILSEVDKNKKYWVHYSVAGLENIEPSTHNNIKDALEAAKEFVESYSTKKSREAGEKIIKTKTGYAIKHVLSEGIVVFARISKV